MFARLFGASKWSKLPALKAQYIADHIVCIGDSIWISTNYNDGEGGMVEYCTKRNQIINVVPYPQDIKPMYHACTAHHNNVYIIDGRNQQSIHVFDTQQHTFTTVKQGISDIGGRPSCLTIHDEIHVFNGLKNDKKLCLVYSTDNNTIREFTNDISSDKLAGVCILKYKEGSSVSRDSLLVYGWVREGCTQHKRHADIPTHVVDLIVNDFYHEQQSANILRFGGYNSTKSKVEDSFIVSSVSNHDDARITSAYKKEFTLKQPLRRCGYVCAGDYVLIFGGQTFRYSLSDAIYLLDLRANIGWIELKHIQCLMKSGYRAILANDGHIHLFTYEYKSNFKHFSIDVKTVLGKYDM